MIIMARGKRSSVKERSPSVRELEKSIVEVIDDRSKMSESLVCPVCGKYEFYINRCDVCGRYFCDDCYASSKHDCLKSRDAKAVKNDIVKALDTVKKENDPEKVRKAIVALGTPAYFDDILVINTLADLTKSDNHMLKRNAVISLGKIRNPVAIEVLSSLKDDNWDQLRYDIAYALGNINHVNGLACLMDMACNAQNSRRTSDKIETTINKLRQNDPLNTT